MAQNVKIIYNKLENVETNNDRYININETIINNKDDLVNMCNIFRNPRYETFRIFYMKNNKIVGQEYFTSKIPNAVMPFAEKKLEPIVFYEKMKNRMQRLGADGYYLAHNHPTESATPSSKDIKITIQFDKSVNGFLGHIVLGSKDRYSVINRNSLGIMLYEEKSIDNQLMDSVKKKLDENTMFDVKITCTSELVALLKQMQIDDNYSIVILTDCKMNIRMVLDIPDRMLNQDYKNLNGYFKNIAKECGAVCAFIGTNNIQTYYKAIQHFKFGTFQDVVYLKDLNVREKKEKESKVQNLFYKEKTKKVKKNVLTR